MNKLTETTAKRYLSDNYIGLIKSTTCEAVSAEIARKLFLFSYYCHGISYIDMAQLSTKNIYEVENERYIVYKRYKLRHNKSAKLMYVKITLELESLIEWFKHNTLLIANYLTPCITRDYEGAKLYEHIKNRRGRYNDALKEVAKELNIPINLTTYVSRHSVAMRLRNNDVAIDKIAQVFGHTDVATTSIYLDSFGNKVIDEIVGVL
ncbi:tyrosine-type recombinase/integrase [Massilibacteroides sp.]|uniref:tyrosine-type recombinase/integrase n=1 Tax=Massilibacteroides sp. TaxID=2034766 RepID=UPI00260E87FC|nr:tyrosine-type recombinase/integrase [Massilibacteroides sp.]MDD4514832.1 tyrosine-type recombinase/integrase [Massilibacteroides sp.]